MSRPEQPAHASFRRFRAPDPAGLAREIEADLRRLVEAQRAHDAPLELAVAVRLGSGLYIAGDEAKAAPILDRALALARRFSDRKAEIEALLHLGTARQYLGEHDLAQSLFQEALALAKAVGIDQFDHFILHHRGRCHAEQGHIDEARRCFEQALALRERLGDPYRIQSTTAALDELRTWKQESGIGRGAASWPAMPALRCVKPGLLFSVTAPSMVRKPNEPCLPTTRARSRRGIRVDVYARAPSGRRRDAGLQRLGIFRAVASPHE
ncbi:MAG TPA: tetratricopeptide repeat protein [Aliidongia sp.]|nr:tetratricopeptide repeat protein [Aliidongia sp.]